MKDRGVTFIGIFYLLIGIIFIISSSSNITGFSIADNLNISHESFYYLGIIFLLIGTLLVTYSTNLSRRDLVAITEKAEQEIKKHIGNDNFDRLSDKDKMAYIKSYVRHAKSEQKNKEYEQRNTKDYHVIRTEAFEKAISGHEQEIERAIDKLERGAGRTEKLKYLPSSTIRTSKGGRIFYDEVGTDIILRDYSPDHRYSKHVTKS